MEPIPDQLKRLFPQLEGAVNRGEASKMADLPYIAQEALMMRMGPNPNRGRIEERNESLTAASTPLVGGIGEGAGSQLMEGFKELGRRYNPKALLTGYEEAKANPTAHIPESTPEEEPSAAGEGWLQNLIPLLPEFFFIPPMETVGKAVGGDIDEQKELMELAGFYAAGGALFKGLKVGKDFLKAKGIISQSPLKKMMNRTSKMVTNPHPGVWDNYVLQSTPFRAMGNVLDKMYDFPIARWRDPDRARSLKEMIQPAVERMNKMNQGTFRNAATLRSLTSRVGMKMRSSEASPTARYELILASRGVPLSQLRSKEAKDAWREFKTGMKEAQSNNSMYETAFWGEFMKLASKPLEAPTDIYIGNTPVYPFLSQLDKALTSKSPKDINATLKAAIMDPSVSDDYKMLCKDLYNLPARLPSEVSKAAHDSGVQYVYSKILRTPGATSSAAKEGFVKSKHGDLKGLYVDKDVELELDAIGLIGKYSKGAYQKWFLSPWKTNKVLLRPASHFRNLMSNLILNDWGGLPFYRLDYYHKGIKGMVEKSKDWKDFERVVGAGGTFTDRELYQLDRGIKLGANVFDRLYNVYDKAVDPVRGLYHAEESMFKFSKYLWNRDHGMAKSEAAWDAMKWTFNYGEITPEVAAVRKYIAPFATWQAKVLPLMAETAVKHPIRFWKWVLFFQMAQNESLEKLDMTEDEWDVMRKAMPDYYSKGIFLPLPWRDDDGRLNLLNLTYIMPGLGDIAEIGANWPGYITQNPLIGLATSVQQGRKNTGVPIYFDWEKPSTKASKLLGYTWEQMVSPIAPGGYDWNNIYNSFTEKPGAMSREAAIASQFGFKTTPLDPATALKKRQALERVHRSEFSSERRRALRSARSAEEVEDILNSFGDLF